MPNRRLVWTDALQAGYRPAAEPIFTAAIQRDEAGRRKHEDMGFHHGWDAALAWLVAMAKDEGEEES